MADADLHKMETGSPPCSPSSSAQRGTASPRTSPRSSPRLRRKSLIEESQEDEWDSTCYDIDNMLYWSAFTMLQGSAWENAALWGSIARSCLVSILVTVLALFTPYASLINTNTLTKLGAFMAVFIGFMLGFFVSSAIRRWYLSTEAFMTLLDSVRQLQMQLSALGVAEHYIKTVSRYGMLSSWLLNLTLHMHCHYKPGQASEDEDHDDAEHLEELWTALDTLRPHLAKPHERAALMQLKDSYCLVWTWVASLIGRLAKDGEIPPMQSPTYGRILDLIQRAFVAIRDSKTPFLVKAPFIYIHTLVIFVHINAIINAMMFGIHLGTTISSAAIPREFTDLGLDVPDVTQKITEMTVGFCIHMIAPALYLTLLDASLCLSQPFKFQDAKIPLMRLLVECEIDLESAQELSGEPPLWEKPQFKTKS